MVAGSLWHLWQLRVERLISFVCIMAGSFQWGRAVITRSKSGLMMYVNSGTITAKRVTVIAASVFMGHPFGSGLAIGEQVRE